jgi:hypothetical protein
LTINVRGHRHHQYRHIRNRGYPPPPWVVVVVAAVSAVGEGAVERRRR